MTNAQPQDAFRHLDHNGDGAIDRHDFESVADAVIREFGLQPDSGKASALTRSYGEAWQLLSDELDTDRDGRINSEEFNRAISQLAEDPRFRSHLTRTSAAEFDAADSGGNGSLDRDDFTRLIRALSRQGGNVNDAFDRLDRDHDGVVSRDEYVEAAAGYLSGAGSIGARVFAGI
ncbi:EF-hand domain-containing protein [Saccharothrix obliqua]|uniref:EF-hand domain-containing protein n=1 Tax=Saccharothrix obliqua TaxID=2861747 RepID=UPI001C605130|nr:EF-hand domain-containing protein [Saccharothrix obliqua]MBW4717830.1 EF-hand domain-containing protein [Saccharothrix obliqua]